MIKNPKDTAYAFTNDTISSIFTAQRQERERIQKQLENLSGISIASSQANYIMVELLGDITATELTERLLLKHKILVKDLSGKIRSGKYIRIAIRNEEDNNRLLSALQEELML